MPSSLYVPVLVAGMLITGSSNSLWTKFQDMQCVENCSDPNPQNQMHFEQPVWQSLQMFLGEMLCFLPVIYASLASRLRRPHIALPGESEPPSVPARDSPEDGDEPAPKPAIAPMRPLSGSAVLLFWLPAACDLTGTTLMNVGLLYTPVSIYQMTRGALVLFVGVLSVIFLRRRLFLYQWLSLVTVMIGICLVGLAGSMIKDSLRQNPDSLAARDAEPIDKPEPTTVFVGVLFILFAQIFTATQFVVEEKILGHYTVPPLLAVGYEGFFGFISILILLPIIALFRPSAPPPTLTSVLAESPYARWFDLRTGWTEIVSTPAVLWSSIAIALSIAFFNFFGLSVTRHVSATVRSLTDTCRTLTIWIVSLGLGWEKLVWPVSLLQVLGFSLLVFGTFMFNSIIRPPKFLLPRSSDAALTSMPTIVVSVAGDEAEERLALLAGDAEHGEARG
ncbi:hypothetical protein GLOTRDRAFT_110196 [Gloeophyllum trabeum ATCC 11539]|uniref:Integral membrane protein n=1 Tax=Gloeophyllum trabeum (strain ATCC 11539 / FP-39264 / Madison 617) TaxID=670483 RepID=S7RUL7_GLOTA|nr:uncharacterized protein GLOTRDRAFT_110196 [Gloeophyllum trabeum ATCC 11539]EPQ58425.1 hypothetical protein GLOTRDRAFT_110196 [Gloeophyllum trabeum ATCC 11539]